MSEWIQALILGIVEGVTEFLPVSSTGHLLLTSRLLHFEGSKGGTFEIFIQFGAVLALLIYYGKELLRQARALPHDASILQFWIRVLIAFLPAAIIGLLLKDWIKAVLFQSPLVIATSLIVGGIVLILVERRPLSEERISDAGALSFRQALVIGGVQALALIPGVSRSGATILGGLLTGMSRPAATQFSFYLAIPTLGAATVLDLLSNYKQLAPSDLGHLAFGTVVATIVAWWSIGWLLRYVSTHSFTTFGIYRIVVGVAVIALNRAGLI